MKRPKGTQAPDRLTDEQRAQLRDWASTRPAHRWALARLIDLEEACLDHFRANGEPMVDWLATVRNWIRRQPEFAPKTTPPSAFVPVRPQPKFFELTPEERDRTRGRIEAHRRALAGAKSKSEVARISTLGPLLRDILKRNAPD